MQTVIAIQQLRICMSTEVLRSTYKQCSDSVKHAKFNIVWITLLIAFTPYTQVIDVNLFLQI